MKRIKCEHCRKVMSSKYTLNKHLDTHLDPDERKKFSCNYCDKTFLCEESIETRLITTHEKVGRYTCEECQKPFRSLAILRIHSRTHLNPNVRLKYRCKECDKSFLSNSGRVKHVIKVHSRPVELTCTSPGCHFIASYKRQLTEHIETIHTCSKKYSCPINSNGGTRLKVFNRNADAVKHYKQVHLKIRVPCILASCRQTFCDLSKARAHYRHVHKGDTARWRCPHCRKLLSTNDKLLKHIASVHPNIRYMCQECGTSFSSNHELNRHRAANH